MDQVRELGYVLYTLAKIFLASAVAAVLVIALAGVVAFIVIGGLLMIALVALALSV